MSDDEGSLPDRIIDQGVLGKYVEMLQPKSDLTYRFFENLSLRDLNLRQSLLNGSLFRNCTLVDVDLTRCDLEGCRFEHVKFDHVDFSTADLRSSVFANSEFVYCKLVDTYINDVDFIDCRLIDCDIGSSVISESTFKDCLLYRVTFESSTVILNRFDGVHFTDVKLGDCTFLLHIMKDCAYQGVSINIDAVGYVFGLREDDLAGMDFIFLGEDEKIPRTGDIVRRIQDEFLKRKWLLASALSRLNFQQSNTLKGLRDLTSAVFTLLSHGSIVKRDEIKFIGRIHRELLRSEALPLAAVSELLETTSAFLKSQSNPAIEKARQDLLELSNEAFLVMQDMLNVVSELAEPMIENKPDRVIKVAVRFCKPPRFPVVNVIRELASRSPTSIQHKTTMITQMTGSVIYILESTVYSMILLSVFLYLLEGTIVQLTRIKERVRVLIRRNSPRAYTENALSPKLGVPDHLSETLKALMRYVPHSTIADDPDLGGYGGSNIESMEIPDE